ncbi:Uncharacterised protein [uncultured Comamonas sp.]|nr:Uncharacterised protein [uncultured Comamonas sp.]
MPREILSAAPETASPNIPPAPQPSASHNTSQTPAQNLPEQPASRDVLAGALPAWDLLPAAPFVRRR